MYFCLEGKVAVGFSLFASRGVQATQGTGDSLLDPATGRLYRISKTFKRTFLICDHYVINNKRSEFVYIVTKPLKCYALTKKFLLNKIFPKYPEIAAEMKAEALLRYRKSLKQPVTEHMNQEYENMNKKSVTRTYEFREKKPELKHDTSPKLAFRLDRLAQKGPASPKVPLSE
jgi:hypothetical protein